MKEELKTAAIETLEAELNAEQAELKHLVSALTRTIGSAERESGAGGIKIRETKIYDLKRQIARVEK